MKVAGSLGRRMAKGAVWMVFVKLAERSIGLVSTMILARLLVPADFGIIAMAVSFAAILEVMGAFSFDIALIQRQDAERRHYDTAWTFNVLYGVASAIALVALARPAAVFYSEARLESVMYAFAAIALIQSLENIGIVAFAKDLELHREFAFRVGKKVVGFVVTLAFAWHFRTFWALVAGMLAMRVAGVALSYRMHDYRPRLSLAGRQDLFHFSKWVLLSNLLIFLNQRSVDFLIGRLAGANALGLYSVSYEVSNLPTTELAFPISRAVFPGYAKIADDRAALRKSFLGVIAIIAIFAVPIGAGISVLAEPFVLGLLGRKWVETIPLIQVLAVFGIVRACVNNTGSVYLALGRPGAVGILTFISLVVLVPCVAWGAMRWGPVGAAWAMLATSLLVLPLNVAWLMRLLDAPISAFGSVLWRPAVGTMIMACALMVLRPLWFGEGANAWLQLGALVPVGAGVYVSVVLLLWRSRGCPEGAEHLILQAIADRRRAGASA